MTTDTVKLDNIEANEEQLLDKLQELRANRRHLAIVPGETAKTSVVGGYKVALDRESIIAAAAELQENAGKTAVLNVKTFAVETITKARFVQAKVGGIEIASK